MIIESITIISPGTGYTGPPGGELPEPKDPSRQRGQESCPRLGSVWRTSTAWVKAIGWQGGYVNLETVWGPRIWLYDEFWDWVTAEHAEIDKNTFGRVPK